jgi:hypothetical protein
MLLAEVMRKAALSRRLLALRCGFWFWFWFWFWFCGANKRQTKTAAGSISKTAFQIYVSEDLHIAVKRGSRTFR